MPDAQAMTCLIRFETTSGTVTHLMCEATEWEVRREVVRIKAEIAKWATVLQVDITECVT